MSNSMARGLVVFLFLIAGCSERTNKNQASSISQSVPESVTQINADNFIVQPPVQFQNLSIFPVASRLPLLEDPFITLDEGLRSGLVDINELAAPNGRLQAQENNPSISSDINDGSFLEDPFGNPAPSTNQDALTIHSENSGSSQLDLVDPFDSGEGNASNQVNTLMVTNRSGKPLYLMAGEVIVGGSQDRTIGQELVIEPNGQPTRVPVFCVEHGRWGAKGTIETLSQIHAASEYQSLSQSVAVSSNSNLEQLAQQADEGKFIASVGQLGKMARLAVRSEQDQSKVWHEVSEANSKSGLSPRAGAFTANYATPSTNKRLEPYMECILDPVSNNAKPVIGVIVAINGKFESIDLFHSKSLFLKLWPKLLKSYSLDAANAFVDRDPSDETHRTTEEATSFMEQAFSSEVVSSESERGMSLSKQDGKGVMSFNLHFKETHENNLGGGYGGMLHFSSYAK